MSLPRFLPFTRACRFRPRASVPFVAQRTFYSESFARNLPVGRSLALGVAAFTAATIALGNVLHLDAKTVPHTDTPTAVVMTEAESVIDPATAIEFPKNIRIQAKIQIPVMSLLGVGVRTVSFLGIKVYSVGLYADLQNPKLHLTESMTPEEKVNHIIENTSCVLRIVPTRSTSYTHLRDAFVRALHARLDRKRKEGAYSDEVAMADSMAIGKLKSLFPNTPLAKHTPFDIYLPAPMNGSTRTIIFRDMGVIENEFVATDLFLHYFEGQSPSPPLRTSVYSQLENVLK